MRTLAFSCVRQSVHVEQLGCHWADFHEILYLNVFSKICRENSSVVKICLTCILFTFMTIFRRIILRMINILDKSCRENQNTHFMFNNFFSRKSYRLLINVEKYYGTRQAPDDNIIRRRKMQQYRHTHNM
jgi:hypothetical protein